MWKPREVLLSRFSVEGEHPNKDIVVVSCIWAYKKVTNATFNPVIDTGVYFFKREATFKKLGFPGFSV